HRGFQGGGRTVRERRDQGIEEAFEAAWSHFYVDTAGTGGWSPAVEMAVRVVGSERILFGSDYPLESHSGATVGELVDMVRNLPGDASQQVAILSGNARTLFRLSDLQVR
ncbi:MAG TPA: amidohydrolase family protein, partial [Chloroflexota bacterium]|nr:amidohydrolase family protein [Chloroflexota bacterium]